MEVRENFHRMYQFMLEETQLLRKQRDEARDIIAARPRIMPEDEAMHYCGGCGQPLIICECEAENPVCDMCGKRWPYGEGHLCKPKRTRLEEIRGFHWTTDTDENDNEIDGWHCTDLKRVDLDLLLRCAEAVVNGENLSYEELDVLRRELQEVEA